MMVYFDTNVLIYAFTKNVDDEKQKNISVQMVGEAIEKGDLIVSELILCEFAFISNKLKETSLYISSFDVYHLAFSEFYNARLITFDKGFKKLKEIAKVEMVIK